MSTRYHTYLNLFRCSNHCLVCFFISHFLCVSLFFFFFQAEDGIRDDLVTGVQTCALPIYQNFAEIEDCSGTVVTPVAVYGFWLDWTNGRHTLGGERTYWHNGEERRFRNEYTSEDIRRPGRFPGCEREDEGEWQALRLPRHAA